MPRRLSARAALALPFLQRMAAAPRELRRAPSGELHAVLSIHSVDSGAGAEDPNPARNPSCAPISEGGASAGSSDRVDADSAMGSQLAGLGLGLGSGGSSGRATAAAAAVKARLSRASAAIALAGRGFKAPPPPEKRAWPPAFLRLHACIGYARARSGCAALARIFQLYTLLHACLTC